MASASRRAAARWASWCLGRSAECTTTTLTNVSTGGLVLGGASAVVACSYSYHHVHNCCDNVSSSSSNDPWLSRREDERSADSEKNSAMKKQKYYPSCILDRCGATGADQPVVWRGWSGTTLTQMEGAVAATEAHPTMMRSHRRRSSSSKHTSNGSNNHHPNDDDAVKSYDFVVIGYGTAGRSAVETLQRRCPSASIALLDPLRQPSTTLSSCVDYYAAPAVGLQPACRTVTMDTTTTATSTTTNTNSVVPRYLHYRHAVLIATGARGAVPPNYLMDEPSRPHIYELRSTILPTTVTTTSNVEDDAEGDDEDDPWPQQQPPPAQRPVQSAEQVRAQIQQLAQQGATIGVVGSGWEAVDVAVMAAATAARHHRRSARPVLIFGSHGPASHTLPQYLSTAVSHKLKSQPIAVLDRSLIRYIAHNNHNAALSNDNNKNNNPSSAAPVASSAKANNLHVYTAKSFDFLEGQTTAVDALVLCPDTSGPRGTAVVPTPDVPAGLATTTTSSRSRCWYQTWSTLSVDDSPKYNNDSHSNTTNDNNNDPTTPLGCYRDDGRIAVHPELAACHGVYAAGSVAKYANPWTGNATVASGGGRIAAHNMAQLYYSNNNNNNISTVWRRGWSLRGGEENNNCSGTTTTMMVMDPIPIWRSDERYSTTSPDGTEPTSLSEIGITALCVGNCEAESMATHGVWWSNLSAVQRRRTQQRARNKDDSTSTNTEGDNANEERRLKQRRREIQKSLKPVYGIGVVYYLDRTGRIQGVMTWGLPFTESEHSKQLNQTLVEQIKTVIRTNGGLRRRWPPHANSNNASNNYNFESSDYSMKMAQYLRDTSEQLLRTALESHGDGFSRAHQLTHSKFPRPLHRFTEVRPPSLRSVSVLRRQDGLHGHGVLGEDMFCRAFVHSEDHEEPTQPSPKDEDDLANAVVGSAVQEKARYEEQYRQWTAWEQVERRWDENEARARPPKEEVLWIRKGDETRNIPHRERMANAYRAAMGR